MIAIDWGTSNFRAFRMNDRAEIIETRSSHEGILRIRERRFQETLLSQIGDWLVTGETRILLCGMVGSRQGWVETGYLPCPVGLTNLANQLVRIPLAGLEIFLVPGVVGSDAYGVPEMMRGEETQAIGVLESHGGGVVCSPGTHSKWINLSDDAIVDFTTCMTGDVFDALRSSTILSRIMTTDAAMDTEAFHRGVARSGDTGGLLHHLFGVRALALVDQLKEESSASYLSGLLIGHEVRKSMSAGTHVHLVGDTQLCSLYAQAISACEGFFTFEDEHAAARGLAAIGRKLSWI
ncbi:MAG: 2-dehydro-3-deoxygalactonokinase [Granulicella sp.]